MSVARVIVLDREGRVLVLRRSKTAPTRALAWDLPGGLLEPGEDPATGAIRELEEEAGIKLGNVEFYQASPKNLGANVLGTRTLFVARTEQPDVVLSYEHDQYKWITEDQLQDIDLPNYYKDAVRQLSQRTLK